MAHENGQRQAPPGPDPALKRLEFFVGTWSMKGRTLDSDEDNVSGQTTFEWLPGGFFLQQRVELDFAGYEIKGLEIIGYDPATGKYPSTVYSSMVGMPLPYEYEIEGNNVTIRTEFGGGATFHGTVSEDGNSYSGGWRPDEGKENPANVAYDVWGTRTG
jgi:Protein of unknown function (DUF1579)